MPSLSEVEPGEADIAWMIYDLQYVSAENRYQLVQNKIVYTRFGDALDRITRAEPGPIEDFIGDLQQKLEDGDVHHPMRQRFRTLSGVVKPQRVTGKW